mmetsp:Transcript_66814/g.146476  ORF Transcript_66814/g.146476 Transcript_66814/m.146476 type:complete len:251 (+) Transcript_66814:1005-1757(+)
MVGHDKFRHGLFQKTGPELVLFGLLCETQVPMLPRTLPIWQSIIDGHSHPFLRVRIIEPDVIASIFRQCLLPEEGPDTVRILRQRAKGGHQPTVAQVALGDVSGRDVFEETRLSFHAVEFVFHGILADHLAWSRPAGNHGLHHLLQVFGHIWIRAVTRHTAKAGIGCRKIWVFKDALARVLLRNTLEVHQFRKCRNDLRRRENPLLMHEIFMCHHHLSFKFFRFATSSPHESNSRSRCSTRSRCQCGQTV